MASYATGTDGTQIVGYGYPGDPETTFFDDARAVVWNAQTGAPTDLGGSNPTFALGVGGAQQVGYEMRGSAEACMWTGTARSLVSLHPRNADASQALATDGVHQVGFASVDVRVFTERRGGRTRVRFNYAYMWNGTKDSAVMLDSFEYGSTVATGISGETACGFGTLTSRTGSYLGYRALAWVGADYHRVELHNLLPQTYISSRALGLDAAGNIVGEAQDAAGTMHAILWRKLTP